MTAGDLKHLITLLSPAGYTLSADGQRKLNYDVAAHVYASMADVSSRDFYAAQAYNAADTVTFGIRWRDDILATWRVRHNGITYEIIEVNHLGYKRDFIHLKCRRVQGEVVS
jgi:SPP1 family predicted phage head-tail adaptor